MRDKNQNGNVKKLTFMKNDIWKRHFFRKIRFEIDLQLKKVRRPDLKVLIIRKFLKNHLKLVLVN